MSEERELDKYREAISRNRYSTGQEGNAQYEISSQQSGKVTFEVQVQSAIIDTVDVEFIVDDGVVEVGENFHNPFAGQTHLLVLIPHAMLVELEFVVPDVRLLQE